MPQLTVNYSSLETSEDSRDSASIGHAVLCCAHVLAGLSAETRIMILVGTDRSLRVCITEIHLVEQTEQAQVCTGTSSLTPVL
jgi:hypothetical protein